MPSTPELLADVGGEINRFWDSGPFAKCQTRVRCGESQRRQGDLQRVSGDVDVAAGGEEFIQVRSAFLLCPQVVGSHPRQ